MSRATSMLQTALRSSRTTITRTARPTLSVARPVALPARRAFAASAWRRAQEADDFPQGAVSPLYERLQQSPEVFEAVQALTQMMATKTGVNLTAGEKPTMQMMYQMASDPELKAASERVMHALRGAGIEIDPREALEALKTMGQGEFDGVEVADFNPENKDGKKGGGDGKE